MQENTDWLINRENSIGNSKEIYVRGKKVSKVMEEDIKILEEMVEKSKILREEDFYKLIGIKQIQTIATFIKAYKEKDKDNNDLRRLYRRTAEKLKENGKEELADYFLAQINEVPTFTVDDDIDYYEEYYKLLSRNKELKEENGKLKEHCKTLTKEKQELTTLALDSIPKSLVKEKIEEIQIKINEGLTDYSVIDFEFQIKMLQELLKGE